MGPWPGAGRRSARLCKCSAKPLWAIPRGVFRSIVWILAHGRLHRRILRRPPASSGRRRARPKSSYADRRTTAGGWGGGEVGTWGLTPGDAEGHSQGDRLKPTFLSTRS